MQNMIARLRRREGTGGTTYHAEYCWERQEEWRRNGGKRDREERWRKRMYLITGEWEGDIVTKRF